jgi:mannosyltransferase OCH1-like enzyme
MQKLDAFDKGMRFSSAYFDYSKRSYHETWDFYRNRYLNLINNSKLTQIIPKKIHQIWLGSELPSVYKPLIAKIKSIHPDWEYKLWTDNDVHSMDFSNKELFLRSQNYGQKSDILRYEILHRYGGIYLDMDFAALKPMDHLLKFDFFGCMAYDSSPNLLNAAIGSKAESCLTKRLINIEKFNISTDAMSVMESTGPYHFTRSMQESMIDDAGGVTLPCTYFYPFPNFPKDRILGEDYNQYTSEKTICCHLWDCSWLKGKKQQKSYSGRFFEKIRNKILFFR